MQLRPHVDSVGDQLAAAAALGDDRTREIAAALGAAAASAVRLALLEAVSAVADEITAALLDAPGAPSVAVALEGDEVRVAVHVSDAAPADERPADGEASARISLRLPEALKAEIDSAAERDAVSVNTWLVRAAGAALRGPVRAPRHDARRVTGWVNG